MPHSSPITSQHLQLSLEGTPVDVVVVPKRKQAVGRFRDGLITIMVPERWPKDEQVKASLSLAKRLIKDKKTTATLATTARQRDDCITINDEHDLQHYVADINDATFQASINGAQFGRAKYSRLAQINLKNRVITVSRFCTEDVPEPALRYLVIHELAHTLEANHSPRFWAHVSRFCPDWRYQSKVIKAIHQMNQQNDA